MRVDEKEAKLLVKKQDIGTVFITINYSYIKQKSTDFKEGHCWRRMQPPESGTPLVHQGTDTNVLATIVKYTGKGWAWSFS